MPSDSQLSSPPAAGRIVRHLLRDPLSWIAAGSTLLIGAALLFDAIPGLRGPVGDPKQWVWRHVWPPDLRPGWLLLPLVAAALIGGVMWVTRRQGRLSPAALGALAGLALAFQLGVQITGSDGLAVTSRTINPAYYGYFPPATEIDNLRADLPDYPALTADWSAPTRLLTHPPGNLIAFWLVIRVFDGIGPLRTLANTLIAPRMAALPDWAAAYSPAEVLAGTAVGFGTALLAALTVFPLYALARRTGSERSARLAAALYPFIPALTLFLPVVDTAYTLPTVGALWLVVSGLQEQQRGRLLIAGLVLGLSTFHSFGLLPVGAVAGVLIVLHHLPTLRRSWRTLLLDGLALAPGVIGVWVVAWAGFGLNPVVMYRTSMIAHGGLTRARSYGLWLGYNVWDVLLFTGLPIGLHALRRALRLVRRLARRETLALADRLLLAAASVMGLIWISGSVRGETARILIFVMPLLAWAAADDVAQDGVRPAGYGVLLGGLLVVQTVVMHAALGVYH